MLCASVGGRRKRKKGKGEQARSKMKAQSTTDPITLHPHRADLFPRARLDSPPFFTPTSAAATSFGPSLPPPSWCFLRWCPRHAALPIGSRLLRAGFCSHRSPTATVSFYSCRDQVNQREMCAFQKWQRRQREQKRWLPALGSLFPSSFTYLLPLSLAFSNSLARRRGRQKFWTLGCLVV
jgi:hypothetical protein